MLELSDRMRRRIAIFLFTALCVAPTLVVAAWGISRHLPTHATAEAQRLSWQLGMDVSLAAVRHPRPGVVQYEGLAMTAPETGREVLRCRLVEARWTRWADGK